MRTLAFRESENKYNRTCKVTYPDSKSVVIKLFISENHTKITQGRRHEQNVYIK